VPFVDAVIVEVALLLPPIVVTVKVAEVLPAGMETVAGTVAAAVLLDVNVTVVATVVAPARVTVPVELVPPRTLVGFNVTLETPAGLTVSVAFSVMAAAFAVITGEATEVTASVVTVNVVLEEPAGTVTDAGTVAAEVMLDDSVTTVPPVGALAFNVTVPVDVPPPITLVGFKLIPVNPGMLSVRVLFSEKPLYVPVIVTGVLTATLLVVIEKVVWVAPAGMVTVPGTTAFALFDVNVTAAPPAGAAAGMTTVPVTVVPPSAGSGLKLIVSSVEVLIVRTAVAVPTLPLAVIVEVVSCA